MYKKRLLTPDEIQKFTNRVRLTESEKVACQFIAEFQFKKAVEKGLHENFGKSQVLNLNTGNRGEWGYCKLFNLCPRFRDENFSKTFGNDHADIINEHGFGIDVKTTTTFFAQFFVNVSELKENIVDQYAFMVDNDGEQVFMGHADLEQIKLCETEWVIDDGKKYEHHIIPVEILVGGKYVRNIDAGTERRATA